MLSFAGMNQEQRDFYKGLAIYILPEGVTEYFDLVDYCEDNASAESLNSKMKCFRASLRGVRDIPYFFYRSMMVFG